MCPLFTGHTLNPLFSIDVFRIKCIAKMHVVSLFVQFIDVLNPSSDEVSIDGTSFLLISLSAN